MGSSPFPWRGSCTSCTSRLHRIRPGSTQSDRSSMARSSGKKEAPCPSYFWLRLPDFRLFGTGDADHSPRVRRALTLFFRAALNRVQQIDPAIEREPKEALYDSSLGPPQLAGSS